MNVPHGSRTGRTPNVTTRARERALLALLAPDLARGAFDGCTLTWHDVTGTCGVKTTVEVSERGVQVRTVPAPFTQRFAAHADTVRAVNVQNLYRTETADPGRAVQFELTSPSVFPDGPQGPNSHHDGPYLPDRVLTLTHPAEHALLRAALRRSVKPGNPASGVTVHAGVEYAGHPAGGGNGGRLEVLTRRGAPHLELRRSTHGAQAGPHIEGAAALPFTLRSAAAGACRRAAEPDHRVTPARRALYDDLHALLNDTARRWNEQAHGKISVRLTLDQGSVLGMHAWPGATRAVVSHDEDFTLGPTASASGFPPQQQLPQAHLSAALHGQGLLHIPGGTVRLHTELCLLLHRLTQAWLNGSRVRLAWSQHGPDRSQRIEFTVDTAGQARVRHDTPGTGSGTVRLDLQASVPVLAQLNRTSLQQVLAQP